jgi:hypothetical protein
VAAEEAKPPKSYSDASIYSHPHLSDTNGTAEPGTIVVGKTPFHFSACTSVTRLGLGAECLGPGFDGGGLGLAGYLDVRGPGFAVKLLRTRSSTAG